MSPAMSDAADMIRDRSLRGLHQSVKRNWTVPVVCKKCKRITVMNDKNLGFCCRHCSTYNRTEEAHASYLNGEGEETPTKQSHLEMPNVIGVDDGKREYTKFRDESQIRADLYAKGITRDTVGVDKFSRTLKRELTQNKCYRGYDKTGV